MDLYVFYAMVDTAMPDDKLQQYLDQLPAGLQQDVRRYKMKADQVRTLAGKLLLRDALGHVGLSPNLDDIKYSDSKRPFIADNIDFNITYSGDCVACAIAYDMKLGIDVEEIKSINIDDIISVLRDEELKEMKRTNASPESILRFWTRKEAIVKASGEGLNMQPQDIYFDNELSARSADTNWYLHELDLGSGYIAYCATNVAGARIIAKNIEY